MKHPMNRDPHPSALSVYPGVSGIAEGSCSVHGCVACDTVTVVDLGDFLFRLCPAHRRELRAQLSERRNEPGGGST